MARQTFLTSSLLADGTVLEASGVEAVDAEAVLAHLAVEAAHVLAQVDALTGA